MSREMIPWVLLTPTLVPFDRSIAPEILVERFFNKIKQCRRVATLHDKLAANYIAFIQLHRGRPGNWA